MNGKWQKTEELTDGMVRVLAGFGISSGSLLDTCCGNGRVSIHMARKGFRVVGVDMSRAFLKDARKRAEEALPGLE
jgi:2-polyprenyl-3-methyl-5-hydroxy-6-metoxy-1,4-benzoquinol methylase